MNVQRRVIYEQRRGVLEGRDLAEEIKQIWLPEVIESTVAEYTVDEVASEWDLDALVLGMEQLYGTGVTVAELQGLDRERIIEEFLDDATDAYNEKEAEIEKINEGLMRDLERFIVLQTVDTRWREHLENMDYLRDGIYLRGMAQKDPLVEYRNEGHAMFEDLNRIIRQEVIALLFHAQIEATAVEDGSPTAALPQPTADTGRLTYEHETLSGADAIAAAGGGASAVVDALRPTGHGANPGGAQAHSEHGDIGRNDACWCGSGKKYKRCHGA